MYISANVAASYLGVTPEHVYGLIDRGVIGGRKDGGRIYVNKVDVLKYGTVVASFFNQKGGVSKTTSTVILSDYFSKLKEFSVLAVDFDPQANLSGTYVEDPETFKGRRGLYDFFNSRTVHLNDVVMNVAENIDLLPSDIRMSNTDKLDSMDLSIHRGEFLTFFKKYDIVLIDCPPSLGGLSRLGVMLSRYVMIPLQYSKYCYDGLHDAMETIKTAREMSKYELFAVPFGSKHSKAKKQIHQDYRLRYESELGDIFSRWRCPSLSVSRSVPTSWIISSITMNITRVKVFSINSQRLRLFVMPCTIEYL
jgi:excisionase family DNA binding protein